MAINHFNFLTIIHQLLQECHLCCVHYGYSIPGHQTISTPTDYPFPVMLHNMETLFTYLFKKKMETLFTYDNS